MVVVVVVYFLLFDLDEGRKCVEQPRAQHVASNRGQKPELRGGKGRATGIVEIDFG